jgi:Na+-translocating ferredoxin:NAD+ oxidoreductase RnfC subunit
MNLWNTKSTRLIVSIKEWEAAKITARRLMKQKALSLSDITTMICWKKMTKRRSINGSSMEDQRKETYREATGNKSK